MTDTIELQVEKRSNDLKAGVLRDQGFVPAVMYGPQEEPVSLQIPINEFLRVWKRAGESTIVDLKGLDDDKEVLIKDVQMHPVKDIPLHVDFYAIERGKTLTLTVPLEFMGEAPAEKQGGVVVRVMHEVEVETRPRNIPQSLEVDLSSLEDMESTIKISDIKTPEGVEIINDKDEVVVAISEQTQEEDKSEQTPEEGEAQEETQKVEEE